MIKSFILALGLFHLLLASPAISATQIYKCNVNGSVNYQQEPCQSSEARKHPTVEALNAERQKKLAQEKEHPTSQKTQAHSPASPETFEKKRENLSFAPRVSFKCDSRKFCAQMTSCEEAKFFLSNCPGSKMDGNKDGTPCEQQWCSR